jgi:hypothetical protein
MSWIASKIESVEHEHDCSSCEGCDGSGIRSPAKPSCIIPDLDESIWTIVERCDTCQIYGDDHEAASVLFMIVQWVPCTEGGHHVIARERRQLKPFSNRGMSKF